MSPQGLDMGKTERTLAPNDNMEERYQSRPNDEITENGKAENKDISLDEITKEIRNIASNAGKR